jgi:hypothetical protein
MRCRAANKKAAEAAFLFNTPAQGRIDAGSSLNQSRSNIDSGQHPDDSRP